MSKALSKKYNSAPSPFKTILPESMKSPGRDTLKMRIDIYSECIILQKLNDSTEHHSDRHYQLISARDLATAISQDMNYSTGLLPENTLWWSNGRKGSQFAIWIPPQVRRLALQTTASGPPQRYTIPLPGLVFLCCQGHAPAVFAVAHRPTDPRDKVYEAPFPNIFDNGVSCPGTQKYPASPGEIPEMFLKSFFTKTADIRGRSKKYPRDITDLWKHLDGKKTFPMSDLVYECTVKDLLEMQI